MIVIREPTLQDEEKFLSAMHRSVQLHYLWVKAPQTSEEFQTYIKKSQQENQKSLLVLKNNEIAGVFNVSEIVRGYFQNAFLGFYAISGFENKGVMSVGLKLVLKYFFEELKLHRIEANIQPENIQSIHLVKKNKFRYEGFSPRYLKINDEWCGHEHWVLTFEEYIQDNPEIIKKDFVDIVAYNPQWVEMAKNEIEKIKKLFPDSLIVDIQHVGSTAIPDIQAKPIIDIQIAVNSLNSAKIISIPLLQKLNYEYWADNPDKTRLFFVKGMPPYGEKRTHHVHIVELDSHHWRDKIAFRDLLRAHPDVAKEYEILKNDLAKRYRYDREKYTDEKADFIKKILK
ncbi:MAG TPA: GNAT family N-acetyltransferase [Coxiellaceae bacterium]|nr:MAG: ribosomal-protein-S5p-alanine acetyltransferase [Gammaproteobacteria bacterium RIFCSPHIGHO2_12_FULL_36_30]HLB56342.1 GNAT family N-acetyltransferase [Coxiellaceae bacterium]